MRLLYTVVCTVYRYTLASVVRETSKAKKAKRKEKNKMPAKAVASYVGRLNLVGKCCEQSASKTSRIDLSDLLSHASSFQQLLQDLFDPFDAAKVDQIVTLSIENQEKDQQFSQTIAGALAGKKALGILYDSSFIYSLKVIFF